MTQEGEVLNNLLRIITKVWPEGWGRPRDGQEPYVNGLCFPWGQVEMHVTKETLHRTRRL